MKSISHLALVKHELSCMFPLQQQPATFCTELVNFTILQLQLTRMYFFTLVCSSLSSRQQTVRSEAQTLKSVCGLNISLESDPIRLNPPCSIQRGSYLKN